ncbi:MULTISPECIES: UDP-N-acetylmuramate dehydrogenase [Enterobacterales]|uniref:UDP-N-acetylmuramate dehydrogenase n=1 Tax=Enterobacterales TaxID=91347 RepID=UPI0008480480|nr:MULTISPECIES: UDP-N-acetylmuramate dehydrogenase [Enterobacterales]WOO49998.1 UDP-N-acetylmuramate dehydrogenase [Hafnia alvei]MCK9781714.1 UDP-N-acetylmuramate dehydrogenase [Proteus columbae]MCT6519360.1 UDP-N-acetylmuramate dehydrogenase [Proteus vulgaris]ODQ05573.1 UDP-N-acetylenolpyruvoylglucosamine reductase [Shigella sp. FC130]OEI93283.1 UDP-N-acetylenolpyruvoylglucosamine reductase [Shigella sp. FC1655]
MKESVSLQAFNTFGLRAKAHQIETANNKDELCIYWQKAHEQKLPTLILGGGSNILFTEDFDGIVIRNCIAGIEITEDEQYWSVHVGAGENWHALIEYLLEQNIYGLENLALIPGNVGSAPIQNIGAYGKELKDVCAYVDIVELSTGHVHRLTNNECQFGYRDSIFKHHYQQGFAIIAVGLQLSKKWAPILTYGDLSKLSLETVTPKDVFVSVCSMRTSKLPNPTITGNAGSFFKNPIVDIRIAQHLKAEYPFCPQYVQQDGVKLAAGWLIDQCGLKGHQIGGAAVHMKQALVLINKDGLATGKDIVNLAAYIRQKVFERFGVQLEPEVRFMGKYGEINAVDAIS